MDPSSERGARSESDDDDSGLVLPAPTATPLLTEDEEEDTTVEVNDAAIQSVAELPVSLSTPAPDPTPARVVFSGPPRGAPAGAGPRGATRIPPPSGSAAVPAVDKPRRVLSWPAALAGGLVGFVLGGVFFTHRSPAPPPVVAAPAPAPVSSLSSPVHHQRKVIKLDEVVLTMPDSTAP